MKILYKPFGIIAGLIGARIAKSVFTALWARIDQHAPPKATTEEASFPKVVGAAATEGLRGGVCRGERLSSSLWRAAISAIALSSVPGLSGGEAR